ncbi:hypothetical protein Poly30_55030 [Planctomycetes bacterium Poly30]|uniref:Uncharacterized protein n=1 Tax=Saltatorellus ferox TaxID=2528018 RepID=A0A518F0S4_9BACT|nr:hypothetical protein Poly30_55030 [Planctomycetes bacterium Poly30]
MRDRVDSVESLSTQRLRLESPEAPRLEPVLPFGAYRMSMGRRSAASFVLEGEAEPVRMSASLRATMGEVSILWTHGEDPSVLFGDPERQPLTRYEVGFPAASIACRPGGRLLIGGLDESSRRPIYEVWTFGEPKLIDDESGEPTLSEPEVLERVRIPAHGHDLNYGVAQAIWTGGAIGDDRAWIFTYPETDVRELDLRTGRSTVMLSPTEAIGAVAPWPGLDRAWNGARYWGDHKACGHCYILTLMTDISFSKGKLTSLILMDRNRDGLLDDWTPLYSQEKYPEGLDDRENWIRD